MGSNTSVKRDRSTASCTSSLPATLIFIKLSIIFDVLVLLLICSAPVAEAKTCSLAQSLKAENAIDNLKSWSDMYAHFVQYAPQCDNGGVAEGVSDFAVHKLASNWESLSELHVITKKDDAFKSFILRHIDASADTDELRLIVKKSRKECQAKYRHLCAQIGNAAAAAIKEAEKYEDAPSNHTPNFAP